MPEWGDNLLKVTKLGNMEQRLLVSPVCDSGVLFSMSTTKIFFCYVLNKYLMWNMSEWVTKWVHIILTSIVLSWTGPPSQWHIEHLAHSLALLQICPHPGLNWISHLTSWHVRSQKDANRHFCRQLQPTFWSPSSENWHLVQGYKSWKSCQKYVAHTLSTIE